MPERIVGKLVYGNSMKERVESRITSQGQVSIPARIRRKPGLTPGSTVEWCEADSAWTLFTNDRQASCGTFE